MRHHRAELHAEFVLALADLVVMLLDHHAHLGHGGEHFGAQVAFAIDRRDREVAALHRGTMAHVAFRIVLDAGLRTFLAVELIGAVVAAGAEPDTVEHEEFGFRPEEACVADAGRLQVRLGLLRGGTRIAVVWLAGRWLDDIADQDQAGLGGERVHHRGVGIRHQDHVGLVDCLPTGDRGAVEHDAVAERLFLDGGDVLRGVLPLAARIGEPQVHIFHGMLGEHLQHFTDAAGRACRLSRHEWYSPSLWSKLMGAAPCDPSGRRPSTRFRQGPKAGFVRVWLRARSRPRHARRCGCE